MMANVKLQAARQLIMDDHFDAARAVLETMPASPTAQKWLVKLEEISPVIQTPPGWEYTEVYVKAAERTLSNVSMVMAERPVTTVDHFFTRLLNEYGMDGWELVSEELQGGDHYRLLFKRPKRS